MSSRSNTRDATSPEHVQPRHVGQGVQGRARSPRQRSPHAAHESRWAATLRCSTPVELAVAVGGETLADGVAGHSAPPFMSDHRLPQGLPRAGQAALHRALRDLQGGGDLLAVQPFHLAQQQDGAMVERQLQQRGLELAGALAAGQALEGRVGVRAAGRRAGVVGARSCPRSGSSARAAAAATSAAGCGPG